MKIFSVEEGIAVQTRHLKEWQKKLKPEVYRALQEYAVQYNDTARDGYGIRRDTVLTTFVLNYDKPLDKKMNISEVSDSFKDSAVLLKEIVRLMAFKYLLNKSHGEEKVNDEKWLRGVSKVIKWMENYED